MARVLIVCERLARGGLETQIAGYVRLAVENGHEVHLAARGDSNIQPLRAHLAGWHEVDLLCDSGDGILASAAALDGIAERVGFHWVHLHPFLSFWAGGLFAARRRLPYIIHIHGPVSLSPLYGVGYRSYLSASLLPTARQVAAVSAESVEHVRELSPSARVKRIPNGVELERTAEARRDTAGSWALVGRLDSDKLLGLQEALRMFAVGWQRGLVRTVRVIGEGDSRPALEGWAEQLPQPEQWLQFAGPVDDVTTVLGEGTAGVAGMGRVVLEAGALNLPVILVGYDGIKGIVTRTNAGRWATRNFSGRGLANLSEEEWLQQLAALDVETLPDDFRLRPWVAENADARKIWSACLKSWASARRRPAVPQWVQPLEELCATLGAESMRSGEAQGRLLEAVVRTHGYDFSRGLYARTEWELLREENASLRLREATLNTQLARRTAALEAQREELEGQANDLRQAQARFQAAERQQEQLCKAEQELAAVIKQRDVLQATVQELNQTRRAQLEQLQRELAQAQRQLADLAEHRTTLQASVEALTRAQQDAQARMGRAGGRIRRLRQRLHAAETERECKQNQLDQSLRRGAQLTSDLAASQQASRDLQAQIAQLQEVLRRRARQTASLQERAAALENQLGQLNETLQNRLAECQWRHDEQDRLLGIIGGLQGQKQSALGRQEEMISRLECLRTWRSYRLMRVVRRFKHLLLAGPRGWWPLLAWLAAKCVGRTRPTPDFDPLAPILAEARQDIRELSQEPPAQPSSASAVSEPAQPEQEPTDWLDLLPVEQLPLVSVLLPVYNHAELVAESIDSVLCQAYPRFELVLLDDGSSDDIDRVLARYQCDPRVRIYRQPNQGLPRALTHLHRLARGELICWTSADNRMHPSMVGRLVGRLLCEPAAVMVFADTQIIDESGHPVTEGDYRRHNRDPNQPDVLRLPRRTEMLGLECDNYLNGCFVYRRLAAQAVGMTYADDLNGLEDYDFWLRLQKAGSIVHLANPEPLYQYRVHAQSMSEELLTVRRKRHLRRGEQLIEYEAQRREWCEQRWRLALSAGVGPERAQAVRRICRSLPVDLLGEQGDGEPAEKRLRIVGQLPDPLKDGFYLVLESAGMRLVLVSAGKVIREVALPVGVDVPLLAVKARRCRQTRWEYPQSGDRPILGTHWPLAAAPVDVESAREVMGDHPQVFFVWIDVVGADDPDTGNRLVRDLPNAVYLGARPLGADYWSYATWQAWWVPPRAQRRADQLAASQARALALASARWCLESPPHEDQPGGWPYVLRVPEHADYASVIDRVLQSPPESDLADRFLEAFSSKGVWRRVLGLANAMGQELFVPRPPWQANTASVTAPERWEPGKVQVVDPEGLRVALLADTLDRGGLEQVVALLACGLRQLGCEVMITCNRSGGLIADRLAAEGFTVHLAEGRAGRLRGIWQRWRPDVVSSHYVHAGYDVAADLRIPLVETVHNMYGHYAEADWQTEGHKARCVARFVAVSELVRRHFLRHCPGVTGDHVEVIPNPCQPPALRADVDLRRQLGIDAEAFVLLNVASFDGRKNQLGLLTAFEEFWQRRPSAVLMLVGNRADPHYAEQTEEYLSTLACREAVFLHDFTHHIGEYYQAADVVVLPSYIEGWSIAATEALMMGRPLIHTECGSAWELCGRFGERGVVIPNPGGNPLRLVQGVLYQAMANPRPANTRHLVRAMQQVMNRRGTWTARGQEIARFARQSFSVERAVQAYAGLLCRIVTRARTPQAEVAV